MRLKDPKLLKRLMAIEGASARSVARAAGYEAHSYVSRLLKGHARSCTMEAAEGIAGLLKVDVGDLFLPSGASESGVQRKPESTYPSTGSDVTSTDVPRKSEVTP